MVRNTQPLHPPNIRVMTWNIHGGVGPDRRLDLQRVVDLIRRHQPQIVALQEIDSRGRHVSSPDPFDFLREKLGGNIFASRAIRTAEGDYGHALISCWPMAAAQSHDISYKRREPRIAIEAVVETPYAPLQVVAAHLGLSLRERLYQAEKLLQILHRGKDRSVLLGDLNDWIGRSKVRRVLNGHFPGHTHFRTFPAVRPILSLDRIYCHPRSMLHRSRTDREARFASDHLPVIADLVL
tara:strand:- start:3375 stop:4088 length:714 start_codon:yes stop_codon:yes gene_type:complete